MSDLVWTQDKRRLSQLIPWPRNPRQIKTPQVKRLQDSLEEFGQPEPIAIGPGNDVYNGHQRLKAWAARFGDIEIDVRVASRSLTEKEREKLTVYLHRGATGEWDFDTLANQFEMGELLEWGFEEYELGIKPGDDSWADAFGGLPDGDKSPFQQMTFTVSDDQAETIKEALQRAKAAGPFVETGNENSNGNALARLAESYVS